jgi:hypothetical protein
MQKRLSLFVAAVLAINVLAGTAWSQQQQNSQDGVWRQIDESAFDQRAEAAEKFADPLFYKAFRLNRTALNGILERAPREFSSITVAETILTLPLPDGAFARFRIENSPIMEPALAAKYPEIQSFRGQGIDNPSATARFDISPNGFRAMILTGRGATVLIEPFAKGDTTNYISFYKHDVKRAGEWVCEVGGDIISPHTEAFNFLPDAPAAVTAGETLRTYRLALAATGEYTNRFRFVGDTDAQAKVRALAAMNTTMNRVNQVFERDAAVRMVLIANTDLLIYTDPNTDPYTTSNPSTTMLNLNQSNIDSVIGADNYDIGHVFSTGTGGIANLAVPCGPSKARGATGWPNPQGDVFDIDFVAHEMGHQFGANHTFNGNVGGCGGSNRSATNAYEPGSGITVMGYAGLCGNQDLAGNSIDTFHVRSIESIIAFTVNGNGNTCAAQIPTGNAPPSVTLPNGASFNIPKQTPFTLTAAATDANGDSLTYDWHQYNAGGSTGGTGAVPNSDADGTPRPLFRAFSPVASGSRTFPALTHILNSANVPPNTTNGFMTGELLPAITRTMNFQVVVRDNRAGGGGVNTASVAVNVDGNSGPFAVTEPNTNVSWQGGASQTVAWNVANTSAAPVNAASVKISLSTDGGQSFPITIVAATPNDGSETITVPNVNTTTARLKIEAVDNIFFDISNANFTITPGNVPTAGVPYDFDGDRKSDIAVFRPSNGTWYVLGSASGFFGGQFGTLGDKPVAADYDGDGKSDFAVFRGGTWFWLNSSNNAFNAAQWGLATDNPMTGDYDGDGKADLSVFRQSDGTWYIYQSSNGGFRAQQFGAQNDKPVVGDFDGDGKTDLAVYRPSVGTWFIQQSRDGFGAVQFGISTDKPAAADYDGDGKTDYAVYRDGFWYLLRTRDGFTGFPFGLATDIPTPGDFDGDGKADISVFRPSDGVWYQMRSQSGFAAAQFGLNGDTPIEAPLH